MLGIGSRSAIAAKHYFSARSDRFGQKGSGFGDFARERLERSEIARDLVERVLDRSLIRQPGGPLRV